MMRYIICLLFFLPLFTAEAAGEKSDRNLCSQKILMISQFNVSYVQYYQLSSSFLNRLNLSGSSYTLDRFDIESFGNPPRQEKHAELQALAGQVKEGKYKIIVCFGLPALELVNQYFHSIPPSSAIIVCGINSSFKDKISRKPNVTGVLQEVNPAQNFALIKKLFPQKKKIILLASWSETGKKVREAAREAIRLFPEMKLIEIDNAAVSTEEMLRQVSAAGPDSVVLFHSWLNRKAVNAGSLQYLMDNLGNKADVPLFVMHSSMLPYGTLGGSMECGSKTGIAAAEQTLRILAGEKAEAIPLQVIPDHVILNNAMLHFYRIPDKFVPKNAVVLGREDDFFLRNRGKIYGFLVVFFCMMIVTAVSLFFIVRHRRLLRQFKSIVANLPVHLIIVDQEENLLLHTGDPASRIRKLSDYPPELYPFLHELLKDVLQNKSPRKEEYILNGVHRRGDFTYLSKAVFGCPAMLGVSIDVNELFTLSQNNKILNECFQAVIPDFNVNASFATILRVFCEHFKGDRCYILHYDLEDENYGFAETIEEYCADGTIPMLKSFPRLRFSKDEPWFLSLNKHKVITFDIEKDRELMHYKGIWEKAMRQGDVKKLYTTPIYHKGKLWGSWGLSFEKTGTSLSLSSSLMQVIPHIASMIELILLRQIHITELSNARDQAQAAARTKSRFLATMSHELRTPLNAVIGFSELLADTRLTQREREEYVSGINLAGKALLSLINDILDFSKIEADQMKVVPAPTDLHKIFRELEAVFKQAAQAKRLALSFEYPAELPQLLLDELRVRQILFNLIGNAIKYTQHGSVSVTAEYRENRLSISVADTGIGIEESAREKIFEPFVQQDAVRDSKVFKGTGLGLAIAGKLAECMNGKLSLESETGKGSTFTLTLDQVIAFEQKEEKNGTPAAGHRISRLPKILLVDDIPLNLKVLEAMFKKIRIPVMKASSAKEALHIMHSCPVDIVFSDMWMPEINGRELAERIHADPVFAGVKVVVITADIEFRDLKPGEFDAVLLKPVTLERLNSVLQKLT